MDYAKFVNASRSAPRDPSSRSGRRPVSIFHDKRQYKLWDGEEEEELPPSRGGSLSSKNTNYRVKSMHRSFQAGRAGPRASARAQVEEIVARGDEGEEDWRFYDSLDRDIDPAQIARLRERNKTRLNALERKLKKLQTRRDAALQGGAAEESSEDEDEEGPELDRAQPSYSPDDYRDQTSDSSPEKRPAARGGRPKSAWAEKYSSGRSVSEEPGAAAHGAAEPSPDAPSERPKLHARIPKDLPRPRSASAGRGGMQSDGEEPRARGGGPARAESPGPADLPSGYQSDPGRRSARRPPRPTSAMSASAGYTSARQERRSCTVPEPFSFDRRERFKKKTIAQARLEQEMIERLELEQLQYTGSFRARPPPKTTTEKLYTKLVEERRSRSEQNRRESIERMMETQQPFDFWQKAREEEEKRLRTQRQEIDRIKRELNLYGVADSRVLKLEQLSWDAVQTDFTTIEQEELRILELKVAAKRKLKEHEEDRMKELKAERVKKFNSKQYTDELENRLRAELKKQEMRFRSVPVPKHVKEDVWGKLELESQERSLKAQERALRLLNTAALPPRMKKHQSEHPDEWTPKHRKYPGNDADTITEHHTFKPKVKGVVPDFENMHKVFKLQLATRKQEMQRDAKRTAIKPFYLRTEWVNLDDFARHKKKYQAAKLGKLVPGVKLRRMGLDTKASQWDVIEKIAKASTTGEERAGLTAAEMIEFGITPPSWHSINNDIDRDIRHLRDNRWPHTKGGRVRMLPTPVPDSMKKRPAKEPSLTVAARARQMAVEKEMRRKEQERKKAEEEAEAARRKRRETWGMKEKVLAKLAKDAEERKEKAGRTQEELEESIRNFKNMDKVWQEKVSKAEEEVKSRGLLMETIKRRLKKQANEQFRKHLKAQGLEDLADEIEMPQ